VKKYLGLVLCSGVVVLSQSCSSGDNTKKARVAFDAGAAGGEAGATSSSGGSTSGGSTSRGGSGTGATAATGATVGAAGEGTTGGSTGASGAPSGAAGEAGASGTVCPTGFGDCDGDGSCETPLNLLTSCGSCTTSCNGNHGTVACQNYKCVLTSCATGYDNCNNDPTDGCEQALTANDHCGECGRNCATYGATCSTSECSGLTIQSDVEGVGTDNGGENNWALTSGILYNAGYDPYTIRGIPVDGSAVTTFWTKNAAIGDQSLVVNGANLMWAERGTPSSTVLQKPLTAAPATLPTPAFVPEYEPTFMRIQGTAMYWMTGDYQSGEPGYVYTRSLSALPSDPGSRIVTVDQGQNGSIQDFKVTSDALYWVTSAAGTGTAYELRTTPLSGGTPKAVPAVPFATGGSTAIYDGLQTKVHIQVLGKTVYFNYHIGTSSLNGIYSYNAGDAAPKQIVSVQNLQSFAVDADSVYYEDGSIFGVFKAPVAGGTQGVNITTLPVYGEIIASDATFVYVVGPKLGASECCYSAYYKVIK